MEQQPPQVDCFLAWSNMIGPVKSQLLRHVTIELTHLGGGWQHIPDTQPFFNLFNLAVWKWKHPGCVIVFESPDSTTARYAVPGGTHFEADYVEVMLGVICSSRLKLAWKLGLLTDIKVAKDGKTGSITFVNPASGTQETVTSPFRLANDWEDLFVHRDFSKLFDVKAPISGKVLYKVLDFAQEDVKIAMNGEGEAEGSDLEDIFE